MEIKTIKGRDKANSGQKMKKIKPLLALAKRTQRHHRTLTFFALGILALILFFPVFYQIKHQEFRSLGLLGVFLLNLIGSATIFFPTPAFISVGLSVVHTNPLIVAFIAASGGALGETTTFLFGLTSREAFNLEKHKSLKKFKKNVFDKWGGLVIFFFAFLPNPLFDGIGMIAGISKYPIKRFLVFTFLGRFMRYLLIGYVTLYIALR